MNRDEALEELKIRLFNSDVLRRSIAVEAVMKEFARHYHADINMWAMAGLLHDIDYEKTVNNPALHSILGAEILENMDFDEAIVYSVRAHNDIHGIPRKRKMDKVLFLADLVCGQIIVCAATLHNKNIWEVTAEDILDEMNENDLAEKHCEELEMALREFIEIALKAMQGISKELEL